MSVTLHAYDAKTIEVLTVATLITRNPNDSNMSPVVGSARVCLVGVWNLESGGRSCVSALDRTLASVAVKMFSSLSYFLRNCIQLFTFSAIIKDCAEIKYITGQYKLFTSRQLRRALRCVSPNNIWRRDSLNEPPRYEVLSSFLSLFFPFTSKYSIQNPTVKSR
jgi:hypothetical protein